MRSTGKYILFLISLRCRKQMFTKSDSIEMIDCIIDTYMMQVERRTSGCSLSSVTPTLTQPQTLRGSRSEHSQCCVLSWLTLSSAGCLGGCSSPARSLLTAGTYLPCSRTVTWPGQSRVNTARTPTTRAAPTRRCMTPWSASGWAKQVRACWVVLTTTACWWSGTAARWLTRCPCHQRPPPSVGSRA